MKKLIGTIVASTVVTLTGCTSESGPKDTVQDALRSLSKSQAQDLWEKLPASYQSDINNGVRKIGARLDSELVTAVLDFVKFVAERLEANRAKLIDSPDFQHLTSDVALRGEVFDGTIACVRELIGGELSSTERMKAFDGGRFLKELSSATAKFADAVDKLDPTKGPKKSREQMANAKVTLISESADAATLELEIPGSSKQTVEMVRVEKRWIPKALQSSWSQVVAALASAEQQVDQINQSKARVIPSLAMGRMMVDSAITSGQIPPLGLSQFTRQIGNALNQMPAN